jgi:small neutral amino acid transporter SnatA (MarC family)
MGGAIEIIVLVIVFAILVWLFLRMSKQVDRQMEEQRKNKG